MAERITSRKNETVRFAAKLGQSASLRRESGLFLAEGARLCADAALSGVRIREVYFTDRAAEKYGSYLEPILRTAERSSRYTSGTRNVCRKCTARSADFRR